MGEEPPASSGWEDVEPSGLHRDRTAVKMWQRRQPLRALDHVAGNSNIFDQAIERAVVVGAGNPGHVMCSSSRAPAASYYQGMQTDAAGAGVLQKLDAGGGKGRDSIDASDWQQQQDEHHHHHHHHQQQQQQQENRRDVAHEFGQGGVVVVGPEEGGTGQGRAAGTDGGVSDKKVVGFPLEGQPQQQSYSENVAPYYAAGSTGNSVASLSDHSQRARRSGGEGGDTSRVRGFHDMICVGFAVSLCLNLGSLTARKEGFFAAQVLCLPEGASETILPDLGIWVGWRQAVANSEKATVLMLEDLSMVGAAMGVLTVVGHATDCLLNAVGLAVLLYGRRKPLKEAQCRLVKRLCLASLAMAGWLLGMTVIGFLVAVEGPIGTAAIAFYTDEYGLDCRSSVSVRVDYAYAMTTLCILCQFFIGIVALPKPSWSPRSRINGRCRKSCCRRGGCGCAPRRRRWCSPGSFCFLCRKEGALDVSEHEEEDHGGGGPCPCCGETSGDVVASRKSRCSFCGGSDVPRGGGGAAAAEAASGSRVCYDKGEGGIGGGIICDPV